MFCKHATVVGQQNDKRGGGKPKRIVATLAGLGKKGEDEP